MKVRYLGGGNDITGFTHGRVYELLMSYSVERPDKTESGEVAIVDNTGDWYSYCIDRFEPVDDDAVDLTGEDAPPVIKVPNDDEEYRNFINAKMKTVHEKLASEGRGEGEASDYMDSLTTPDIEFITSEFGLSRKDLYAMTKTEAHNLFLAIRRGFLEEVEKRKGRGDEYISERGLRFSEVGMRMQFFTDIPKDEQI